MRARIARSNTGQGLLETIVALGILTSGLFAIITLAIAHQSAGIISADRLAAVNLAREGIEVIRNIRDSNWLARQVFSTGLIGASSSTIVPMLDSATNTWSLDRASITIAHQNARIWQNGGVFFQTTAANPPGATLTNYRRLLTVIEICADKTIALPPGCGQGGKKTMGLQVRSTVQWITKGQTHRLTLEEHLFDWR